MKKYLKILLSIVSIISLIFCGCSSQNISKNTTNDNVTQTTLSDTKSVKTLIVYYSYSGTTKRVSQHLQSITNGDLYEITLKEPYSGNDNDVSNRVFSERGKHKMPELDGDLPDISNYDIIFIGTPVWNSSISNPVVSFLEQADFKGKTVAPFWTYITNEGKTKKDFSKLIQNGTVVDGLSLASANSIDDNSLDSTLKSWIKDIY